MSDESTNGKGNAAPAPNLVDQLVLTYDRVPSTLTISGKVINNETALDMLNRAVRYYETVVRLEAATQIRQQQVEAAETEAVRRALAQRRG